MYGNGKPRMHTIPHGIALLLIAIAAVIFLLPLFGPACTAAMTPAAPWAWAATGRLFAAAFSTTCNRLPS